MTAGEQAVGAGFGHAEAAGHDDALAQFALGALEQRVPHRLRQRCTGVEEHLDAREEVAAQRIVGLHRLRNGLEARRHVEVHRWRDLAQVAQRLVDERGRRLAFVDVERAAIGQHHAEVVVAAEGVVPGQPVDQHRALLGQDRHRLSHLLLVGAPHAVGVDDGLGQLGRAAGEQELDDGVGRGGLLGGIDGGRGFGGQQFGQRRAGTAAKRCVIGVARQHDFAAGGCHGGNRRAIARAVLGPDQARRQRVDDVAQLAVVLADGRIRGRGGRIRHAGVQAAERQQRVIDAVVGQDHHRPLGRQPAREQRLADAASGIQRLRVADVAPVAELSVSQPLALGDEGFVGRGARPMDQAIRHARVEILQRHIGRQVLRAVIARAHFDAGDAEGQRAVAGRGLGGAHACLGYSDFYSCLRLIDKRWGPKRLQAFLTFVPALPSRKSRTRCLASGAACAMALISASVM